MIQINLLKSLRLIDGHKLARDVYLVSLCMAYAISLTCWFAAGQSIERARAAQTQQSIESAKQIQQLADKVTEHDLKFAVDEASQKLIWEKLTAIEIGQVALQTKVDGMISIVWGLVIAVTPLALNGIVILVGSFVKRGT